MIEIEIEESLKLLERYRKTLETVQSEDFQNVLKKHHMGNIPPEMYLVYLFQTPSPGR